MIEFDSPTSWGKRLALLLRRNNMTGKDLADKMSVSPMTVSKWLNGGGINDERLDQLCRLFSATRAWLRWGEDFFDDSVWLESSVGEGVIRKYINGTERLSLATTSEAAHGYVTWMVDSETQSWQWSGNAHRFYGIEDAHYVKEPLHIQIRKRMAPGCDKKIMRMIDDVANGTLQRGWIRFTLVHKPHRRYLAIARNVPSPTGKWRVLGLTINDGGPLADFINCWEGPASIYEGLGLDD